MYHPFYDYRQVPHYHSNPSLGTGMYPDTIHLGGRVFSRSIYSTNSQAAQAVPAPSHSSPSGDTPGPQARPGSKNTMSSIRPKSSIKQVPIFMSNPQQRESTSENDGPPPQRFMPNQPQPVYPHLQPPFSMHPFLAPFSGWPPQPNTFQSDLKQEHTASQADTGALTHYTSPHPRMYPYVPPGTQPMPIHPMMATPSPSIPLGQYPPQQGATNLAQPSNSMSSMGAQLYSMPFSQVPPKLKCDDCGRDRSSKYQWIHRKSRRRKSEPNICRRCRKSGTDSEYESDNSEDEQDLPRTSRSRRYSRGSNPRAQLRARSRARSSSRPNRRGDFDFYAYHDIDSSDPDSSESEDYQRNQNRNSGRRSRPRSTNFERARSQLRRSNSRLKRVVYVESRHGRVDTHSDEEDVEVRYVDHHARPVVISRPSTPAVRAQPTIQLDTDLRTPIVIERREYYEDPWPPRHPTRPAPSLNHPHASTVSLQDNRHGVESYAVTGEGRYHEIGTDGTSRGRGIRTSARSRSRSHFSIDEGAESGSNDRLLRRASSPARTHRRAPRDVRSESSREDSGGERRSYRSNSRRRRSRDRNSSRPRRSPPSDDYDWYDKDGLKVRVREI